MAPRCWFCRYAAARADAKARQRVIFDYFTLRFSIFFAVTLALPPMLDCFTDVRCRPLSLIFITRQLPLAYFH